ncbi:MAG: hypothetical protein WA655_02005 [Candidatus Korobacteraceae bacterium]
MLTNNNLSCRENQRESAVRAAPLFGLDFVDVSDDQKTLEVFFLGKAPANLTKANVRITGGRTPGSVQVTSLLLRHNTDPALDDTLEVNVNQPGDYSTYTLSLVKLDDSGRPTDQILDGFDPMYASVDFSFKAGCPTDLDCRPQQVCAPPTRTQPEISYLAKDYNSFRQLILDRLALIMPGWSETHVPDIGIMLVEVLAYVGDYLSYYQDAVATEAYLGTARQRISVRRHARLVDYAMLEGCNARAWITIHTDTDGPLDPTKISFITGYPGSPAPGTLQPADIKAATPGSYEVFEPLVQDPSQSINIYAAHSEIHFYTWGNCQCCLPVGATSATLVDQWTTPKTGSGGNGGDGGGTTSPAVPEVARTAASAGESKLKVATSSPKTATRVDSTRDVRASARTDAAPAVKASTPATPTPAGTPPSDGPPGTTRALQLQIGNVLIFEEVIGPRTGNPADADPTHRQAVRITNITWSVDPLYHPTDPDFGQPIVTIEWCPEDALTFPLCISTQAPFPQCDCLENLSVARGNVILVDHGAKTSASLGTVPTLSTTQQCATKCSPSETSIVPGKFCPTLSDEPLTFAQPLPACGCASAFVVNDPRQAVPAITLQGTLSNELGATGTSWTPARDLLESGPNDATFVVEMDNDGAAHLRFGDGVLGKIPDAGTQFAATYRLGNGTAGNVGADTIVYLLFAETTEGMGNLQPRNPLPAAGGTDPESLDEVRMFAPYTFRDVLERAITADDYASLAADNTRRLADRPELLAEVTQPETVDGAVPQTIDEKRLSEEEEPGEPTPLGPDICNQPFVRLQGAKASLRWTGSWYEALVAIDPAGAESVESDVLTEIADYLEPFRRMGHDLDVRPADYVPLDLALRICVLPDYQQAHVESALLDVFSNRVLPDGTLGFFHPDNLTFGQGIYTSRIIATAQAVTGVQEAQLLRLERYEIGEPAIGVEDVSDELPVGGVLPLGPFEIARLDNDPNAPENGRLTLDLRGGR